MNYQPWEVWTIIGLMAVGTIAIRGSFLVFLGGRAMPQWVQRWLRYTPVAVLPGLVAPAVIWPAATMGEPDPARIAAALVTALVGLWRRDVLSAVFAGLATLAIGLYLTGQI